MSDRIHRPERIRRRIWEAFGRTCQMCQQETDERGFDLDHHIPLKIGGEDSEDNLRPLCRPCHRLKTRGDVATIAKARRQRAGHTGTKARSPRPMPGGRDSPLKITLSGAVVDRRTGEPVGRNDHGR